MLFSFSDGSVEIGLLFIGQRYVPGLAVGVRCQVEGTAQYWAGNLVIWNPIYEFIYDE